MRYLVLSDIHANLEALESVLTDASNYERVLMLGDVVGYGASPNEVVERVRALPNITSIRGNHDKVAARLDPADAFNRLARFAILWTTEQLTTPNLEWLVALAQGPASVDGDVEICHGSPLDEDLYILDESDAMPALKAAAAPVCLFGHTHVPAAYCLHVGLEVLEPPNGARHTTTLERGRYLINCGAVGQPRDGDPRAAYGVLDTEARTIELCRVEYDIRGAQQRILDADLPEILAERLARGR